MITDAAPVVPATTVNAFVVKLVFTPVKSILESPPLAVAEPVTAVVPETVRVPPLPVAVIFAVPVLVVAGIVIDAADTDAVPCSVTVCDCPAAAFAVNVKAPVIEVVVPVANVTEFVAVGLAIVSAPRVTVFVLLFVKATLVGTVSVPPRDIALDPLNDLAPVPVNVTAPVPELNVVPLAVIFPPNVEAVAKLLAVFKSKTPVLFTVTLPVNTFAPVALETFNVAPLATVVVPANVIATAPIVVVPLFTDKIPNVVARLSVTVPDVFNVVPALIVTVDPKEALPIELAPKVLQVVPAFELEAIFVRVPADNEYNPTPL
jgi:hypothetical protein